MIKGILKLSLQKLLRTTFMREFEVHNKAWAFLKIPDAYMSKFTIFFVKCSKNSPWSNL
jgi:hypothetical protein